MVLALNPSVHSVQFDIAPWQKNSTVRSLHLCLHTWIPGTKIPGWEPLGKAQQCTLKAGKALYVYFIWQLIQSAEFLNLTYSTAGIYNFPAHIVGITKDGSW